MSLPSLPSLHTTLKRVLEARETLSEPEARDVMRQILSGTVADLEIAALLGALAARGERAEEIAGFAQAMRETVTPLPLTDAERSGLIDTCGTGGDASGTFNISTAAALVAAAAGATVAKHGNRAVTSICGSADVLEALGVPIDLSPEQAAASLRTHRFAFLAAAAFHPAVRSVLPVRRAISVRTIFNVTGPLANPAGARRQVMGVYSKSLVPLVAQTLVRLGSDRALVVHGETGDALRPGLDELSISGESHIAEVRGQAVRTSTLRPEDAGLSTAPLSTLAGGNAQTNAAILAGIFRGEPGPPRDVVLLNAAAVLLTAGLADDLREGVRLASEAIRSGAVTQLVASLRSFGASDRTETPAHTTSQP